MRSNCVELLGFVTDGVWFGVEVTTGMDILIYRLFIRYTGLSGLSLFCLVNSTSKKDNLPLFPFSAVNWSIEFRILVWPSYEYVIYTTHRVFAWELQMSFLMQLFQSTSWKDKYMRNKDELKGEPSFACKSGFYDK